MPTVCYLESEGKSRRFNIISTDRNAVENFVINEIPELAERFSANIVGRNSKIKVIGISSGYVEVFLSDELTLIFIIWFNNFYCPKEILLECPSREELEKLGLF